MRRDEALAILAAHRDELRETYGVKSLALFGSVARDEAGPESDVDLLVEFDRPTGLFGLAALQIFLEQVLGTGVDIGRSEALREYVRGSVEQDLVYVS